MNRRGVALFEAVVAFSIVAVVATTAMGAVAGEMRTAERARRAMETQALALSKLDFIPLLLDAELLSLPDSVESGTFDAPMDEYSWHMTSDPVQTVPGVYEIRLDIFWPNNSFTVQTFAYRRPVVLTAQ